MEGTRMASRGSVKHAKKPAARNSRKAKHQRPSRARSLIDDVTAVLLISPDAKRLSDFYKTILGLPLQEENHDGIAIHYGYSLGDVHFAIHSAGGGWTGVPTRNAQSPVISLGTSNLKLVVKRLAARGVEVTGPTDHGFGYIASFRDPDGNHISLVEYAPEHW
jgi:predicted enzyme related to lactoylglutathione lyase